MTVRPVIAGNWKMNLGPQETRAFFKAFRADLPPEGGPALLLFPPALSLAAALESRQEALGAGGAPLQVQLGVQNLHWEERGAFTGEISAPMARAAGATHALAGHSERRHLFGESDEEVARKVRAALQGGLVPVLCVGETLQERRAGRVAEVILDQLDAVLPVIQAWPEAGLLLAYEPVWAIGTGETATPEDASQAHEVLRRRLEEVLGELRGGSVPLLYGGSVTPENARELLEAPEVNGVLVGGASLSPDSFRRIAEAGARR